MELNLCFIGKMIKEVGVDGIKLVISDEDVVGPEQEYFTEMILNIPNDDTVKFSVSQTLLIIWHQIEIKISFERRHDILLEREVKIVNIPINI